MFVPDNNSLHWLLEHWQEIDNETTRQAVLMMMHENYQAKGIPNTAWMNALLNGIHCEKEPVDSFNINQLPVLSSARDIFGRT